MSLQDALDVGATDPGASAPLATGPASPEEQSVGEALRELGSDHSGHGRLVLVDAFHLLPAADVAALVEWLQQNRFTNTVVVIGVHPIECPPESLQLLSQMIPAVTIDLPRLATEQLRALLSVRHPKCPPQSMAQIAEFSRGIPSLAFAAADDHCLQTESEGNGEPLRRSLQSAVLQVSLPILARHGAEILRLGLTGVLAAPEGSIRDLPAALDHAEAPRVETLLQQIGLLGGREGRADVIREAFIEGTDSGFLRESAAAALDLLQRVDAPPERILELVELLGPEDGNYLTVAKCAVDGFLGRGLDERALELALQVLRRSRCPDVMAWARSVALTLAMSRDWARARKMMLAGGPEDALIQQMVATGGLTPEFSVDAAHAVGAVTEALLAEGGAIAEGLGAGTATPSESAGTATCDVALVMHHHLMSGRSVSPRGVAKSLNRSGPVQCVELSSLLTAALRGNPAEQRLERLQDRLTGTVGTFSVGAHRAALLAITHLALSNHEAAIEWSSIATITAGPEDLGSSGLGHATAALSQLRLGQLEVGATHAKTAADIFTSLRADHLAAFAMTIASHIEIERGCHTGLPVLPEDRWHPVLKVYATYVRARHLVAQGQVDQGITELFRVGRHLESLGLANPTLVNWRPHLISVFRGSHKDDFADIVEADLLRAMRSWHRGNPAGAVRRSHILGHLAQTLVVPDPPESEPEPDAPDQARRTELSEAESRVVRLVVQGQSNREVARELYLSKRTIDTHLSNVYRKLGLRSRGELEDYVRELAPSLRALQHSSEWSADSATPTPVYG